MYSQFEVFDCHCDTLTSTQEKQYLNFDEMKKYGRYIQVFAICAEYNKHPYFFAKRYIKKFNKLMHEEKFDIIRSSDDLKNCQYGGLLAFEGADCLQSHISALRKFYKQGLRLLTISWNTEGGAASPISSQADGGLTPFGRKLIAECEKLGIVVDLSHISDKSFWDVCEIATNPFICSHSNSRTINPGAKRNITDEQFKALIAHDGCVGITLCADFIGGERDMSAIIKHIEHFCSLGGEKNIGIGTDFDGTPNLPSNCNGVGYMYDLAQRLLSLNYSELVVKGSAE